jgi:hypothetical protein
VPAKRRAGTLPIVTDANDDYLAREAKARKNIDRQLGAAGWIVQNASQANVSAGPGVAIREFVLEKGHGRVDYPQARGRLRPGRQLVRRNAPMAAMESSCVVIVK